MINDEKPSFWSRLKGLFSRVSFTSDDESDDLGTRAMKRAKKQQRRRDEFVTKRELDVLRKVRRERDVHTGRSKPNLVQPQGALLVPPGSAKEDTLRKINEIERMMSVDIKSPSKQLSDKEKEAQNRAFLPTQPMSAMVQRPVVVSKPPDAGGASPEMTESQRIAAAFARTDVMTRPMTRPGAVPAPAAGAAGIHLPAADASDIQPSADYLNSILMGQTQMMSAMEVQELSNDPVLEEAAIHFANAEYAEAERTLKNAITPEAANYRSMETWRALFDLYRATGEQSKFESVGLDFVSLFDTSAPNWFSLMGEEHSRPSAAQSASAGPAAYNSPTKIDAFVASQMQQFVEMRLMGNGVVALDFSKLQIITVDAADSIAKMLLSLNATPTRVSMVDAGRLSDNLQALMLANDKTVPQALWTARLEWLRLQGKQDEFETVALDYCVAFEVSPPSWSPSKASLGAGGGVAGASPSGSVALETSSSWSLEPLSNASALNSFSSQSSVTGDVANPAALMGEIVAGDTVITPEIAAASNQHVISVTCARLKRIDFASAGTLLNWVLEQVGAGHQVQFYDTHRLIAAFFGVIGISGHARVVLRKD